MTTIIKPNESHHPINWFYLCAGLILFIMAIVGIFFYNGIVDAQHRLNQQKQAIETTKENLLELKNRLYQLLDSRKLIDLQKKVGLVEIKTPEFIQVASPVTALTP